ncbi:hypothetical protein GOP47_0020024 [Adiantum capillus-veneris]|uniref:Uncharacterized protein n=1 Tax=Adiantum capillus-veneris TaxID=13818 RepID=A0A9D4UC62_ADICA|nr:hypothetical protein GOP47_0020024 [Adiantum capillus-veneris]
MRDQRLKRRDWLGGLKIKGEEFRHLNDFFSIPAEPWSICICWITIMHTAWSSYCKLTGGVLLDISQTVWELEITVHKMNATATPDGKVLNMFCVTDSTEMLHEKRRQDDLCFNLKSTLGEIFRSRLLMHPLASVDRGDLVCSMISRVFSKLLESAYLRRVLGGIWSMGGLQVLIYGQT